MGFWSVKRNKETNSVILENRLKNDTAKYQRDKDPRPYVRLEMPIKSEEEIKSSIVKEKENKIAKSR